MQGIVVFDSQLLQTLETHRTILLDHFFLALTQLGDARAIIVVMIALIVILWRHKRYAYKAGLGMAVFGSLGTSFFIKMLVERPRPPLADALVVESGYSFPSMHAAVAFAVYGFLIYTVYRLMRPHHHRTPVILFLVATIALIGFSRMYLGVHYASDIIAGYIIGLIFAVLGIATTRIIAAKGPAASRAAPFARSVRNRPV